MLLVKSLRFRFSFGLPCASARKLRPFLSQGDLYVSSLWIGSGFGGGLGGGRRCPRADAYDAGLVQRQQRRVPFAGLTLSGSTLYGTTVTAVRYGDGTVFSIPVSGGSPTVLASFNGSNGERSLCRT